MKTANNKSEGIRLPILQGVLPIKGAQVPAEIIAGITLAALAVPEVMGYTKISGIPVITGLYTILIPMALFSFFGSSRHLCRQWQPDKDTNGRQHQRTHSAIAACHNSDRVVGAVVSHRAAGLHADAVLSADVFLIGVGLIDLECMREIFAQRKSAASSSLSKILSQIGN